MSSNYKELLGRQRDFFYGGKTRDIDFRIEKLKAVRDWCETNEARILAALHKDLKKHPFEAYLVENMGVTNEIRMVVKNLHKWARPHKVRTPLAFFRSSSKYYYEPFGTTLILTAWNYPFLLGVVPAIGAIAAGNCCIIKPSELAPHTSQLLVEMIRARFQEEHCTVVEGGAEETTELLKERFDFIHYTGGSRVGKIVGVAAANHMTPVVLEMGGKSPCFVDETADLEISAQRICLGKFMNAGQTCVAPDFIFVHNSVKDGLIEALRRQIRNFYGSDPQQSADYGRIINERHFDRVSALLEGVSIVCGGKTDRSDLYIEPTILDNATWDSLVMKEEIFGPVLPVLGYDDLPQVISQMKSREKPLATYIFSKDKAAQDLVMHGLPFGGGGINTIGFHAANSHLPFGGVGNSGMGHYHGKWSFETFSHKKGILKQELWPNNSFAFPPFKESRMKWLKRM